MRKKRSVDFSGTCDIHDVCALSVNWSTSRAYAGYRNEGTSRLSRMTIYDLMNDFVSGCQAGSVRLEFGLYPLTASREIVSLGFCFSRCAPHVPYNIVIWKGTVRLFPRKQVPGNMLKRAYTSGHTRYVFILRVIEYYSSGVFRRFIPTIFNTISQHWTDEDGRFFAHNFIAVICICVDNILKPTQTLNDRRYYIRFRNVFHCWTQSMR